MWSNWFHQFIRRFQTRGTGLQQRLKSLVVSKTTTPEGIYTFSVGDVDDASAIHRLQLLSYEDYEAWYLKDFSSDLSKNKAAFYILIEFLSNQSNQTELVGVCSGRFTMRKSHISHLMIHPDFQGKGLGQQLIDLWVACSKAENQPMIELEVRKSNLAAQNLYLKNQFNYQKLLPYYYESDFEDAWRMRRIL